MKKTKEQKVKENLLKMYNILDEDTGAMEIVQDHDICYGEVKPVCGIQIGGRGLTLDLTMITCPQCRGKLKKLKKFK